MVVLGAAPMLALPLKRAARSSPPDAKLCSERTVLNCDALARLPEVALKSWQTPCPSEASEETRAPSAGDNDESERDLEMPRRLSCSVQHDYVLDAKSLGAGGLCDTVTSARPREGGAAVAVKRTNLRNLCVRRLADCRREAELHLQLEHPHIAQLHRVYEDEREQALVMELLEGGDTFDLLESRGRLSEVQAASYLRQALLALEYLHARGIVHRDIKPENLVFADKGRSTLKLIDFGLARRFREGPIRDFQGTPHYMAPETFRGRSGSKADLWSLGVVAYVFLCGVAPWVDDEAAALAMIQAGTPRYSASRFRVLSAEAQDFVEALLTDEAQRLDATAALQHPWIQSAEVEDGAGFWAALRKML